MDINGSFALKQNYSRFVFLIENSLKVLLESVPFFFDKDNILRASSLLGRGLYVWQVITTSSSHCYKRAMAFFLPHRNSGRTGNSLGSFLLKKGLYYFEGLVLLAF